MDIRGYLPSAQFTFLTGSLLLSAGLVAMAQALTAPQAAPRISAIDENPYGSAQATDWQATLREIQGRNPSILPEPPSREAVQAMVEGAKTANVTDSLARGLLVNLSDAKFQGLGSDIPTQERLIAQAQAQIYGEEKKAAYEAGDLTLVDATEASLREYGNAVMLALSRNGGASMGQTLVAVTAAIDTGDSSKLSALSAMERTYRAVAAELARAPAPRTLAPLHLAIINNFSLTADSHADMRAVIQDPLRGLAGLQRYQELLDETERLFTSVAAEFPRNAILFNESEPGAAWSEFLPQ